MKILTAILTQSLRMKVEEDKFPCLLSNLSFLSDMQTDQLDLSVLTHRSVRSQGSMGKPEISWTLDTPTTYSGRFDEGIS